MKMPKPWSPREDKLLGTNTDAAIAAKLGRTRAAVETRRLRLQIAAYHSRSRQWTVAEIQLLGTMSDADLADQLGCRRLHVLQTRQRHGVACYASQNTPRKFRRKTRGQRSGVRGQRM